MRKGLEKIWETVLLDFPTTPASIIINPGNFSRNIDIFRLNRIWTASRTGNSVASREAIEQYSQEATDESYHLERDLGMDSRVR